MGAIPNEVILRTDAWHRFGEVVGDNFDFSEARERGMKFTLPVEKVRMSDLILGYTARDDEYAAVRGDGVVLKCGHGEQWTPFQVEEGYEFGRAIANLTGATLESLGTMDDGRKWFMTFRQADFQIGDFTVKDYLSANGSFDGSWLMQVLSSPIVEVCENTIAAAKAAGTTHYRFKHTSGIFDRVEEAVRASELHRANRMAFQALGNELLATSVGHVQYKGMLDLLFPVKDVSTKTENTNANAREKVNALYTATGEADLEIVSGVRNTAWGFVQAVNTYENWGQPIRKTKGLSEAQTRAARQIDQLVSGKQPLTDKALDLVMA